jgi:hypothetical protein
LHDRSALLDHAILGYTLTSAHGKLFDPWEPLPADGSQYSISDRANSVANRQDRDLVDRTLDLIYTEVSRQCVVDDTADGSIATDQARHMAGKDRAMAAFLLLPCLAGVGERRTGSTGDTVASTSFLKP